VSSACVGSVYLEADELDGGYTCFPQRELCVMPRVGAALLFQVSMAQLDPGTPAAWC
jgi:hypothetical protein